MYSYLQGDSKNDCQDNVLASDWKEALLKPLLKKCGLDIAFNNFRPVSNLPLVCENICFSSLLATGNISCKGMSAIQRQKFHTDDSNQYLHKKSGSHGVPNKNLFNFTCLLVDFGKVLCSSANKLQRNSNASSREDYIPQILTVLLEILRVYI